MQRSQYRFISKCDGLELDVLEIYPFVSPKGIVQLAHGMSEHKERYIEFMEFLARHGYIVVINDHRGHGKSLKTKDDQGYFYDDSGEYIVEDIHDITLMLKEKYPNLPIYLFGHSMGALVVSKYLKKYDDEIEKMIVCGIPGNNPLSAVALNLVNLMEKVKGSYHRSHLIQSLSIGAYDRKFKDSQKNSWLSANPENVKYFNNSNDCGFTFTLNGFKNLFIMMQDVYNEKGWLKKNLDLPILFVAGEYDPVIMSKDIWRDGQVYLNKIGYTCVKGKLYRNIRHEILMEERKKDVMEDILKFIEE